MALIACSSVEGFFSALIRDAFLLKKWQAGQQSQYYVAGLLGRFANQPSLEYPLSIKFLEAYCQDVAAEHKVSALRDVGDMALCYTGLFADSLQYVSIDVALYEEMGELAYNSLSSLLKESEQLTTVYHELSEHFIAFVDVLREIRTEIAFPEMKFIPQHVDNVESLKKKPLS